MRKLKSLIKSIQKVKFENNASGCCINQFVIDNQISMCMTYKRSEENSASHYNVWCQQGSAPDFAFLFVTMGDLFLLLYTGFLIKNKSVAARLCESTALKKETFRPESGKIIFSYQCGTNFLCTTVLWEYTGTQKV